MQNLNHTAYKLLKAVDIFGLLKFLEVAIVEKKSASEILFTAMEFLSQTRINYGRAISNKDITELVIMTGLMSKDLRELFVKLSKENNVRPDTFEEWLTSMVEARREKYQKFERLDQINTTITAIVNVRLFDDEVSKFLKDCVDSTMLIHNYIVGRTDAETLRVVYDNYSDGLIWVRRISDGIQSGEYTADQGELKLTFDGFLDYLQTHAAQAYIKDFFYKMLETGKQHVTLQ